MRGMTAAGGARQTIVNFRTLPSCQRFQFYLTPPDDLFSFQLLAREEFFENVNVFTDEEKSVGHSLL
jgi:hypothetical protein